MLIVVGTFEHSVEVEQALADLEQSGVPNSRIMAVPMNESQHYRYEAEQGKLNAFDVGIATATAAAVIGVSSGFSLHWGPIIWGIISCILGYSLGALLFFLLTKRSGEKRLKKKQLHKSEVVLIIQCSLERSEEVKRLLWRYGAGSVGTI